MRRFVVVACICWLALCSADEVPNTFPLAFGMTPDEASAALGKPLAHIATERGADIFVAEGYAHIPGFYAVGDRVVLKFRKGSLTGWKPDWRLRPHFPF
jgi:hypothetical protein